MSLPPNPAPPSQNGVSLHHSSHYFHTAKSAITGGKGTMSGSVTVPSGTTHILLDLVMGDDPCPMSKSWFPVGMTISPDEVFPLSMYYPVLKRSGTKARTSIACRDWLFEFKKKGENWYAVERAQAARSSCGHNHCSRIDVDVTKEVERMATGNRITIGENLRVNIVKPVIKGQDMPRVIRDRVEYLAFNETNPVRKQFLRKDTERLVQVFCQYFSPDKRRPETMDRLRSSKMRVSAFDHEGDMLFRGTGPKIVDRTYNRPGLGQIPQLDGHEATPSPKRLRKTAPKVDASPSSKRRKGSFIAKDPKRPRIGINGFGRIGRLVFRAALDMDFEIVAVNDPCINLGDMVKNLKDDRHGSFEGVVGVAGDQLFINGKKISVFGERDPNAIAWGKDGADYVIESTGVHPKSSTSCTGGAKVCVRKWSNQTSKEVFAEDEDGLQIVDRVIDIINFMEK